MYIRTREASGETLSRIFAARPTQARFWEHNEQLSDGLAQPAASIPACISKPSWIPALKHFFAPKAPSFWRIHPSLPPVSGRWPATPVHDPMHDELRPGRLNPGYLEPTTHRLIHDPNLDRNLKALIADLYAKRPPFDRDPFKTFVDERGKIRVALVDLSTASKLLFPKVAEYESATETYGASLTKIGILYAAYQFRFDLNVQAKSNPSSMTASRIRQLKTIFDIIQAGTGSVASLEFNRDYLLALKEICENRAANKIMSALGFGQIASSLWKSGLYDCRRGGIWLGALFDGGKTKWRRAPRGRQWHAVNALSVASFLTLLAQGRLIDDHSSRKIREILSLQPGSCGSRFTAGLRVSGRFGPSDRIDSKIGVYGTFSHEAALIQRSSIGKKYVVVVLTDSQGRKGGGVRESLIMHLDKLIEMNP